MLRIESKIGLKHRLLQVRNGIILPTIKGIQIIANIVVIVTDFKQSIINHQGTS